MGELDGRDGIPETMTEILHQRHQGGDEAATARMFLRLRGSVLAIVRTHTLFPALESTYGEEDIVGELWTRLLEGDTLSRFQDQAPGSMRAFVYRVLDCLMVDLLRRSAAAKRGGGVQPRRIGESGTQTDAVPPPRAPDPGPATAVGVSDWVTNCEAALEGREREAWCMRTTEGLDFKAIAERLGCTESAARGVMHRAIQRLIEKGLLESAPGASPL